MNRSLFIGCWVPLCRDVMPGARDYMYSLTISRLLETIGLFCKRDQQKRLYSAKGDVLLRMSFSKPCPTKHAIRQLPSRTAFICTGISARDVIHELPSCVPWHLLHIAADIHALYLMLTWYDILTSWWKKIVSRWYYTYSYEKRPIYMKRELQIFSYE